jgi:hypothetical protein
MTAAIDFQGIRFGKLVGIDPVHGKPWSVWLWQCDCGSKKEIIASNVKRGLTRSCGCVQKQSRTKHGAHKTRTYQAWINMKARVAGNSENSEKNYTNRGISVCQRWEKFEAFIQDMGECPEGLTLDRYPDNDGNYEPGNCRWATPGQQSANTRRTRLVVFDGREMCLAEACRLAGLNYRTAMKRISRGMTAQQSLKS